MLATCRKILSLKVVLVNLVDIPVFNPICKKAKKERSVTANYIING